MAETVTIPSRVECIDDARRWVTARAEGASVGRDAVADMELALTEALANVIKHAYAGRGDGEILVGAEVRGGAFAVSVRDWGIDADPSGFERRDLDDPGEGGYGLFLIEQLMDDVIREPQPDGGTLLTLVKNVGTPPENGGQHG
jgi:anti-sigma regulatory factor (Ser/Thr protein kinase)